CAVQERIRNAGRIDCWRLRSRRIERRAVVGPQSQITTCQKELNAIVQVIIERDLGNCRIDGDLHLRPVDLLDRPFNNSVVFPARINQQAVIDDVWRDPHAGEQGGAAAGWSTWQGADDGPAGRRCRGQVGATSALRRWCGAKLLSDARIGAGRCTEARSELSIPTDLITL